jgi:hypothetical protein
MTCKASSLVVLRSASEGVFAESDDLATREVRR